MRELERLLIIALNEQAVNTVVEIMHTLCAEFLEGEDDIAGILFNKYFCKLYPEMQRKYIHTSPFEHHANKLAKKYGIAQPWREISENPWEWEYKGFEQNPHGINQCDMPKLNIA